MIQQPIPIRGEVVDKDGRITKPWVEYFRSLQVSISDGTYVVANPTITAGVHTKIAYDEKGLVISGSNVTTSEVPEGTNLYFTEERVIDSFTFGDNLTYDSGTLSANVGSEDILTDVLMFMGS